MIKTANKNIYNISFIFENSQAVAIAAFFIGNNTPLHSHFSTQGL